jgi:ankyrin repeat protein
MNRRAPRAGILATLGLALVLPGLATAGDESPIADAARAGDGAAVRELLRAGNDVNDAHGDGMTALHWAAMNADAELAATLLYAGANASAKTRIGGYTPLLVAARHGYSDVIEALLAGGADAEERSATGATPLMLAAGSGSPDAVRALLEHGADADAQDAAQGQTALMFAAASNAVGAIDLLAAAGADLHVATRVSDSAAQYAEMIQGYRKRARLRAAVDAIENPPDEDDDADDAGEAEEADATEGEAGQEIEDPSAELKGDDGASKPDADREAEDLEPETLPEDAVRDPQAELVGQDGEAKEHLEGAAAGDAQEPDIDAVGYDETTDESEEEGDAEGEDETARLFSRNRLSYGELVGSYGGMTALLHASRQGHVESVQGLVELGADIDQVSADGSSPLLVATINGHFDLALYLLEQGADPTLASEAGATPLYAALNVQWAPKTLKPQPRAHLQQQHSHIDLMEALLEAGADPNVRLEKKIWYSGYNFDLSGVDESGATPFWRAAYGSDVPAMRLLVAHGADPHVPTVKPPGRPRTGDADREIEDVSGLPPVPVGGPAVPPLLAAAGVGYGEGFAANSHRNAPGGWLPAVKYLVEELGADVNAVDHEGNTVVHMAAARGDNEMIRYLVAQGADVTRLNREGNSTADMANGPVQRIQPFPATIELLVSLGAVNHDRCVSC